MANYLCVKVTFLDPVPTFHGSRGPGEPEWPPSPLRLYQALLDASASLWRGEQFEVRARPALEWLAEFQPPVLVAPACRVGSPFRIAVPNNDMNNVAIAWAHRREPKKQPSELKTLKTVRPTRMILGEDESGALYYLWPLADPDPEFERHSEVLLAAARSITHLGWGVDMVAACASVISAEDADKLQGERWRPTGDTAAAGLRVPIEGTLDDLIARHNAFLGRVRQDGFHPVPPLSTFGVAGYSRSIDPPQRPYAAFSLLKPDASGFRPFGTVQHTVTVAAMMRHAASGKDMAQALGWPVEKVSAFVLGHGEAHGEPHTPVAGPRLAFIPLPSIEPRGSGRAEAVGSVRRALLTVFGGDANEDILRLARLLSGAELMAEGETSPVAWLSRIPNSDRVLRRYIDRSSTWATVTPVILPGYDDPRKLRRRLFASKQQGPGQRDELGQKQMLEKLDSRIDFLLRKAIRQAGYSQELARAAEIECRGVGFWPGTDLAVRYNYPEKLRRFRRVHVRITWRDESGNPLTMPGPICLGGGRFHGLGLFAGC